MRMRNICMAVVLMTCVPLVAQAEEIQNRITVLVDAFGDRSDLKKDWGYSALVEYSGRRILFDTGNDVVIYVPDDEYFGGPTSRRFFEKLVDTLPPSMRYFDGRVPDTLPHGSPWKHAKLHRVSTVLEIFPGIRVVRNISAGDNFTETPELSLVIDAPGGQILLVGCAHPGIEQILESVHGRTHSVRLVMGGLHWLTLPDAEVERRANDLVHKWGVHSVAPGHCTGEVGFSVLSRVFGDRYLYAGLGRAIDL
jgi:7,8-dihydropterin-6-yl-methyl-4-(beta-D-ribofuranosyl)aminobenzene 5'-phosphate synthase